MTNKAAMIIRAMSDTTLLPHWGLIRAEGALVGGEGKLGNVLKIRPPIVFRRADADFAVAAIDRALSRL